MAKKSSEPLPPVKESEKTKEAALRASRPAAKREPGEGTHRGCEGEREEAKNEDEVNDIHGGYRTHRQTLLPYTWLP